MPLARRRAAFLLAATATLLPANHAGAALVPLLDLRQMHVAASYEGVTQEQTMFPPGAFLEWNDAAGVTVEGLEAGLAEAGANQNSSLYRDLMGVPTGFFHAGGCAGSYQVGTGTYEALSLSTMVFQLTTTSDFFMDATFEPGDTGSQGQIVLGNPHGAPHLVEVSSGHVMMNGRLGPGDYFLEGRSQVTTNGESTAGPTYAIFMTIQPTNSPFIQIQPSDIVIPPGGNGSLSVTTGSPAPAAAPEATAAMTFQWRRNRVPLTDGGHFSGATTNTLSITGAAIADSGWYDVVVTSGPVQEPSRDVRVTVGVTGVAPIAAEETPDFTLDPATPNPSASTTAFRFASRRPMPADASVYDASGRRIRVLPGDRLSGSGTLSWDGRTDGGERAPAGVYFLRVRADGRTHVRRFVRLRS